VADGEPLPDGSSVMSVEQGRLVVTDHADAATGSPSPGRERTDVDAVE